MLANRVSYALRSTRILPSITPCAPLRHASRRGLSKSSSDDDQPLSFVDVDTFRSLPRHELSLMGNLGKDLDLRKTPKGADVASGTLAVKTTTEAGDSTTWWKLTFWGDAALSASAAVSKGTQVMVKGPASINTYTTASGENRETLELTVKEMTIIQKTKKE